MLIKRISYSNLQDEWSPKKHIKTIEKPDYEVKKLKEICEINPVYRRITEEDLEGRVKEIEINSIDELGRVISPKTISNDEEKKKMLKKADYKAKMGDVLVPLIQVKNYTPVIVNEDDMIVSNNFALLESKLSQFYLYWALSQEFVKKQVELKSRGSVIKRIKLYDLREIEIPWLNESQRKEKEEEMLFNLSEKSFEELNLERKEKINKVFEREFKYTQKDLNHQNIQRINADNFIERRKWETEFHLRKELGEIVKDTSDFKIKPLKELIADISVGINKYRLKEGEEKVFVIKSKDLGVMDYKSELESMFINPKKIKEVRAGDILMRRRGGIGPAVVYRNNKDCTFDDTIVRIRVNEKAIVSEYLAMYLNSNIAKYLLGAYLTKKSTTYIKVSDLKKIEVLVPSIKKQREIILKGGEEF